MRITSPEITNSVPRCAPLMTTSLHRRRLTVAGVASRRIRVPVKCSIEHKAYHDASGRLVWPAQCEYRDRGAARKRAARGNAIDGDRVAWRVRDDRTRAAGAGEAVRRSAAV